PSGSSFSSSVLAAPATAPADGDGQQLVVTVVVARGDGLPRGPRELEDDERDSEADERISDRRAERGNHCRCDDAERDEPVDASVIAVGDQRGAVEPAPAS